MVGWGWERPRIHLLSLAFSQCLLFPFSPMQWGDDISATSGPPLRTSPLLVTEPAWLLEGLNH
jgi:hypothetical protein